MNTKYSDSTIEDLLNLCTFLDPRFKFDYIKKDTLYDSTVTLIKGTVQEVLDLIKKDQECEINEQHDDLQKETVQPSQPPRKKNGLQRYLRNLLHHMNSGQRIYGTALD